jgi:hypothetical protein
MSTSCCSRSFVSTAFSSVADNKFGDSSMRTSRTEPTREAGL